jgi:hypothetical protein
MMLLHATNCYLYFIRRTNVTSARQYKHHLKQWGITKNVSSFIKDKAIKAMGKRARDGSVVAGVRHEGSELDKKRLRRYMSTQAKLEQDLQINNNV